MKLYQMKREQLIGKPIEEVFAFFAKPENLALITPDWLHFKILTPLPVTMKKGTVIEYQLKVRGFPMRWKSEITEYNPPHGFVDLQTQGPYRHWEHFHRFQSHPKGTLVIDEFHYALPLGWLGRLLHPLVKKDLEKIFSYRRKVIAEYF